jgi:micrococcal nuclease
LPAPAATLALAPSAASPSPPPTGDAAYVELVSVLGGPPNGRASATARTHPGAACTIAYRTPAGTSSVAQGLFPKTADASGSVSWSWQIGSGTRPGTGTVVVTCDGQSARAPIRIG